jgi:hypothetical protein
MKRHLLILYVLILFVVFNATAGGIKHEKTNLSKQRNSIFFFENQGEFPDNVSFYAKTWFGNLFVNSDHELVYSLPVKTETLTTGIAFKEKLLNANSNIIVTGENGKTGVYNMFKPGMEEHGTKTNYESVLMSSVYEGIDLQLKMTNDNIEKIFIVKPTHNPDLIRLQIEGVNDLFLENGKMIASSSLGNLSFTKPIAFQFINGKKVNISVEYILFEDSQYGFSLGEYNPEYQLFIDPLLASTFVGGTNNDWAQSIAFDNNGKLFVTGYTWSSDYPVTTGAYDESITAGNWDTFISRFDSTLVNLEVSTFIGGTDADMAIAMTIDETSGDVYVAGDVESSNFPVSVGAYQTAFGGGDFDIFICRLSNDLSTLEASTYLGGSATEKISEIIYDQTNDKVFVTGYTESANYPTTIGSYDETKDYGSRAVIISQLNQDLTSLEASTLIEGALGDESKDIIFENSGDILIVGHTLSPNYPTTAGAYDTGHNSGDDVFISRLSYDLSTLNYSSFIGGTSNDKAYAIFQDSDDNIYLTGHTSSTNYPTTTGAFSQTFDNAVDAFVSKLPEDLSALSASTFISGSAWDYATELLQDSDGFLLIAGRTQSTDFPVITGSYDTTFNGATDVFITKMNTDLTDIPASTFLGGSQIDFVDDMLIDQYGQIFVTGYTTSEDYPVTTGVFDEIYNGVSPSKECFIAKLDRNLSTLPPTIITQPVDVTVCENTEAVFVIEADGGGNLTYQWYQGTSGIYNPIPSATNDTLTILVDLSMDGDSIFCEVTNEGGNIFSDTVRLNVDELIPSDAGIDQSLCEINNAVMNATAPSSGTGFWHRISGAGAAGTPNDPGSAIIGLDIGDNEFVWEVTNGACIATDTVNLRQDTIITANAGTDFSICLLDSTQLNANIATPGIGSWAVNEDGVITDVNNPTAWVTNLTFGENSFSWEITNGACTDSDDIIITRDSIIVADAGIDQIFCDYDTSSLTASLPSPGSGIWSIISGNATFDDDTNPSTPVSDLEYGINELEWTVTNGACISSDTLILQRDSLIVSDAGTDLELCDTYHQVITAEDPEPGIGNWLLAEGSGTFAQANQHVTTVSGLGIGNNRFVWEVVNGVCISTDTLLIHIDTTVIAQVGPDIQICNDSSEIYALNPNPGTGLWSVYDGSGTFGSNTNPNTYVTNLSDGTNTLRWTVTNGVCVSYDEMEIFVDTIIHANAGNDTTICHTSSVILNASVDAPGIGSWSLLSGNGSFANVHDPNTIISNLAPEENYLIWSVESGSCISYDTVVIYRDTLIFAETEADFSICGTETEISANMPTTPMYSGFWQLISGNAVFSDSTQMTCTVTNLAVGENIFQWNVTNGFCTETAQLTVFADTMINAVSMGNQALCDTNQLQITAQDASPASAWWSIISGGGIIADTTANETLITDLPIGETVIQWNVVNGACTDQSTFTISNYIMVDALLPEDFAVCDTMVILEGNDPSPGNSIWTVLLGNAEITDSLAPITDAHSLDVGINTFLYTIANGACISSDTLNIQRDTLIPANAGDDISLCQTDSIILPVNTYSTWSLTSGSANINNTYNGTDSLALISNIGLGENVLNLIAVNGSCIDTDELILTRDSLVIAYAGLDQEICDDETASLVANQVGVGTGFWSSADSLTIIDNPMQAITTVSNMIPGENNFIWTVENGACISFDTISITVNESVFIIRQPQTHTLIQGDTVMFIVEAEGDFTEFQWMKNGVELSDTLNISGAKSDTLKINRISIDDAGTYACIVSGLCNDLYSNSAELFVNSGISVFPNPTPDIVYIHVSRLEDSYTVRLYDAIGRLVKQDESSHNRMALDMSELRCGMYILSIEFDKETINYKIIKD